MKNNNRINTVFFIQSMMRTERIPIYVDARGELHAPSHIYELIEKEKVDVYPKLDGHFSGVLIASERSITH